MQPASQPGGDVISLKSSIGYPSGPSSVEYDVMACGPHPYHGVLVIGGKARLAQPLLLSTGTSRPSTIHAVPYLIIHRSFPPLGGGFGGVQIVDFHFNHVLSCSPSSFSPPPVLYPNEAAHRPSSLSLIGNVGTPIQQSWRGLWGWWHGPHMSQLWPYMGALPQTPAAYHGLLHAYRGLRGDWSMPEHEYIQVHPGNLTALSEVSNARPPPTDPIGLSWTSRSPIAPMAQITDNGTLITWQQAAVLAGVSLGVGTALLGSMMFEALRPRQEEADALKPLSQESHDRTVAASSQRRYLPWVVALFAIIAFGRERRRKRRQ